MSAGIILLMIASMFIPFKHSPRGSGCQINPQHLGWQKPGVQGGQYSRPVCVADKGKLVWCDQYCKRG